MWLIVASGLYLYAFFETSVAGALASVEALTYRQPWAGGVLRSVHRYASDGMVLTMLLHMTRHWAFDRFRGYPLVLLGKRARAAVAGVRRRHQRLHAALGPAGAVHRDRRGRVVRLAAHVRRHADAQLHLQENVSDRLFSLLSFMHIGVPLVVLRCSGCTRSGCPRRAPRRPCRSRIALTGALIVLSVVRPAVSQGGQPTWRGGLRLVLPAGAAADVPLDALGQVWVLVGAASALLFLLPWLPPKRRGAEHTCWCRPGNRIVAVRAGETLLDAGLREGIALPFDCRNGGCGECLCTVDRQGGASALPAQRADRRARRRQGACRACTPREDVEPWTTSRPARRRPAAHRPWAPPWTRWSASRPT